MIVWDVRVVAPESLPYTCSCERFVILEPPTYLATTFQRIVLILWSLFTRHCCMASDAATGAAGRPAMFKQYTYLFVCLLVVITRTKVDTAKWSYNLAMS